MMQQNSKCRLCGDRDKTINHIIRKCNKLAQKEYKTRPNWVGKVIHWELYKKFQFDHTNKWYMHNPTSSPGEWHTLTPLGFWHPNGSLNLDQMTRPYYNQQKKKRTCKIVDFPVLTDHRVKLKESKKKYKFFDLTRNIKTMEHKSDNYTSYNWYSWYSHQKINKGTGGLGHKRTSALLNSARILRRVLETWGDLLSPDSHKRTIS